MVTGPKSDRHPRDFESSPYLPIDTFVRALPTPSFCCGCCSCASHSRLSLFAQSLSLCRKLFQVICFEIVRVKHFYELMSNYVGSHPDCVVIPKLSAASVWRRPHPSCFPSLMSATYNQEAGVARSALHATFWATHHSAFKAMTNNGRGRGFLLRALCSHSCGLLVGCYATKNASCFAAAWHP